MWTTSVTLDERPTTAPRSVSDTLLAALAAGDLEACDHPPLAWIEQALATAEQDLQARGDAEDEQRRLDNTATIELRRTSLRQSHERKVRQVRSAIETLRATDNERMITLQESQIAASERRLEEALRNLEQAGRCALTLEHLAVCVVRVLHE